MEPIRNDYKGPFGPHIKTLIELKRRSGFVYDSEAYLLKKFDEFCVAADAKGPGISRDLVLKWGTLRDTESRANLSRRITAVRQLCIYMNSIGISSYVPKVFTHKSGRISHVLDDGEIAAFFNELDSDTPKSQNNGSNQRISFEMKVLFRLIYCCGLRLAEATHIKLEDLDLAAGVITVYHSKGRKDRLVYLSDDMAELLKDYLLAMEKIYGVKSQLLFPAQDMDKPFPNGTVSMRFNKIWGKTAYAENCVQKPTVHSLRHSFVVKRMNLWMAKGEKLEALMPYLSMYLGHSSVDDSFYYYHQISQAFQIVKDRDQLSDTIIPEADYEKETKG